MPRARYRGHAATLLLGLMAAPKPADAPENLEYGQLTRAQDGMRGISAEMRFAVNAPDLPTLQQHAAGLARDKGLRPKINRLRRSKAWGDLGDLKRELLDLWTEERNTLAKEVMKDIEAQRKQRRKAR